MATEQKQHVLNDVTDILGIGRWSIKRPGVEDGSSLPSHVFRAAALQTVVTYDSMPATNERIIKKAGLPFKSGYDSRNSQSEGGGTVTLEGLRALRKALSLLVRPAPTLNAFLLSWNPDRSEWHADELASAIDATALGQIVEGRWSTGRRTKGVSEGDRAFLLRQGREPRGIVASGTIRSRVFQDAHFSTPSRIANYVWVDWDVIVAPDEGLPVVELQAKVPIRHKWEPQASGTAIGRPQLEQLERVWLEHLAARHRAWKAGKGASGQARLTNTVRRKTIEVAAQNWLMKLYSDAGWFVEDTHIGNPFDARASRAGQILYLEAKGTQSAGKSVTVTRGEIKHAKANPGQCVIGIWSGIRLINDHKVDPKSGTKRLLNWDPKVKDLAPISYDWIVRGKSRVP